MGVNDLFDNMIKAACRINDEEYDYICENLTDDESLIFLKDDELSIKEKREFLRILESHLEKFYA
ncbi:MAG: hypothetical protein M0R51_06565 [Clostridia bacterium]|nr:hypothetical protein [Clostridia bacterium]